MGESKRDEAAVVGAFLQRYMEDRARGVTLSLGEYQADYPGYEEAIAREHGQLEALPPAEGATEVELDSLVSSGWRRYHIQGEIARGGFGTILRAWDRDLRRTLAMKVLRGRGSSSKGLSRFLEEAQITGQLDHPGIVPVHELGLDSDGHVYFTMSLVRGRNFQEIIDLVHRGEEGWTLTRALGVIQRVCEAVAFAHSKGVLHRDLKPANIMVGRFGETLVMDWGLAHVIGKEDRRDIRPCLGRDEGQSEILSLRRDPADETSSSPLVTMEGDVIGTPAYMPPEQAQGHVDEMGVCSDAYAIGAMLYHLLAGRMPYDEENAPVSSKLVLARVIEGAPRPLHEIRPDVPAELVAICEKAMARSPGERYSAVLEIAEDISAFLEMRVVHAYETGAFAELRKWIKRNRALSLASAAAVLTLVAGLVFSLVQKQRADENALLAGQQAKRAEANFEMAFEAVDEMLSDVGAKTLANVPRMDSVRRSLLEKALAFHQRFLTARRGDPGLRREVARSYARIGKIHRDLGDITKAEVDKRCAIEILSALRRENPDDLELLSEEIAERIAIAAYAGSRGEIDEAQQRFESALAPLEELIRRAPEVPKHRLTKANLLTNIAVCLHRKNKLAEAVEFTRRAVSVQKQLVDQWPDNPSYTANLALSLKNLAYMLGGSGRREESEVVFREAVSLFRAALERDPENREYRFGKGEMLNLLALVQKRGRKYGAAEKTLREAVRMLRGLVTDYPDVASYHGVLGGALCNLALVLQALANKEQALRFFEEAIDEERQALDRAPDHKTYRDYLFNQHVALCKLLLDLKRHRDAKARAEDLAALPFGGSKPRLHAALYLSMCSDLAARDPSLSIEERASLRDRHADRAMELLHQAVEQGLQDASVLGWKGFKPIEKREDFQRLGEELARKKAPGR